MKRLHIEHPEDMVLSGELNVLNWFTADSHISTKIDGSPAIVWGTNPSNNKFFVGTKSVFNKKLIKINHDHREIDANHQGEVADILHKCLDNIHPTTGIFQGDFIGFGGRNTFLPNTIEYEFPDEEINQEVIIAPHTYYEATEDLRDAVAYPLQYELQSDNNVLYVQPECEIDEDLEDIQKLCDFAKQIATLCDFPSVKQVTRIKKQLNTCFKEGIELDDITLEALAHDNECDINVLRLWKLVKTIKDSMLEHVVRYDDIDCYIDDEECDHEGYVLSNEYGVYKIIDRETFSAANFNRVRS
jgi:hypothetical protein